MDTRTFADTVDALTYDPLIAKEWTEHHTIPLLEAVESSGRDVLVLARTLHNPSSIRCLLYFDLLMAKLRMRALPHMERFLIFIGRY